MAFNGIPGEPEEGDCVGPSVDYFLLEASQRNDGGVSEAESNFRSLRFGGTETITKLTLKEGASYSSKLPCSTKWNRPGPTKLEVLSGGVLVWYRRGREVYLRARDSITIPAGEDYFLRDVAPETQLLQICSNKPIGNGLAPYSH